MQTLGLDGIDKRAKSRTCQALDAEVDAFRNRALTAAYPYVGLDALYLSVRETGEREVIGFPLGVLVTSDNH